MSPTVQGPDATICACATALPAETALLRLSGRQARSVAAAAGLALPAAWRWQAGAWALAAGRCPVRVAFFPAGRSATGCDLVEIALPGAPDLVALGLARLQTAGAEAAVPGAFSRQAWAHGRLDLDQAQAVLALAQAPDRDAARLALQRLQGALADELEPLRQGLLEARARVEAGLDFIEEDDVQAYDPAALSAELQNAAAVLGRWRRAITGLGEEAVVCLVGPANAGKSALFSRLGGGPALVSSQPGTTRDWLQQVISLDGRQLRLIDTAGWLSEQDDAIDVAAVAGGRRLAANAALILVCLAPDVAVDEARLAELPPERSVCIATKADLGPADARAVLAVSAVDGSGLDALRGLIARRLAERCGGDQRQAALLEQAGGLLAELADGLPPDEILASDLRRLAGLLAELVGRTADDEVLEAIFGRFCIGK